MVGLAWFEDEEVVRLDVVFSMEDAMEVVEIE